MEARSLEETIRFVEDLKRQWMACIDAINDPLLIIDRDYHVLKGNHAAGSRHTGSIRNAIGEKCYKVFAGRDQPCGGCRLQDAFKVAGQQQFHLSPDTAGAHFEVSSHPITMEKEGIDGVLNIYRDRTETDQLQQKLLQQEKMASIGLLAGGIAHELNNPIGGILVFSQMILRELSETSDHYEDVKEIEQAAFRCKDIIQGLLDFARAQPTIKKTESVNLEEVIEKAQKLLLVGKNRDQINITHDFGAQDFHYQAHSNTLIQVFLNLFQNAVSAMDGQGSIHISSYRQRQGTKDFICFDITDSGVGMSNDQLSQIFDPFYTSKPEGEGTGLGLSIVYGIMEGYGGQISVKSQQNVGSTFTLWFPVLT